MAPVLAAAFLFREPLLCAAAAPLVYADPPGPADRALLWGGDRVVPEAAALLFAGRVRGLLLIEPRPNRLQRHGVVPLAETWVLRELAKEGVSAEALEVIRGEAFGLRDAARLLRERLDSRPGETILILVPEFESRMTRLILSRTLTREALARTRLRPLPDREVNVRNWWRRRSGFTALFTAHANLLFQAVRGEEGRPAPEEWDPDAYEARLRADKPHAEGAR